MGVWKYEDELLNRDMAQGRREEVPWTVLVDCSALVKP